MPYKDWKNDAWQATAWANKTWHKKNWKIRSGLRRRLTVYFAIVALAAVSLTGYLSLRAIQKAATEVSQVIELPNGQRFEIPRDPWGFGFFGNDTRLDQARQTFRNMSSTIFWGGAGAVLLAIVAAALVTRRLTKPLIALEQAALAVSSGERGVRVPIPENKDELQTVSLAFNQLSENLERQETWRQQVVADIAHDLRNPLGVMRAELEAMQDGIRPRDDATLERLLGEVSLISRMVTNLRTLSTAETGALKLEYRSVEVSAWLEAILGTLQARALESRVALMVAPMPTLVANFDPLQFERVVRNLLENALEHSGGSRVVVSCILEPNAWVLHIADNGRGLPSPERVFERFYRGDASRERTASLHNGLGLSISKAIVEAHGGTIEAINEAGAIFRIRMNRN
jgi:two-component system, OmpR family, sensor histidine kinase BaeS